MWGGLAPLPWGCHAAGRGGPSGEVELSPTFVGYAKVRWPRKRPSSALQRPLCFLCFSSSSGRTNAGLDAKRMRWFEVGMRAVQAACKSFRLLGCVWQRHFRPANHESRWRNCFSPFHFANSSGEWHVPYQSRLFCQ